MPDVFPGVGCRANVWMEVGGGVARIALPGPSPVDLIFTLTGILGM